MRVLVVEDDDPTRYSIEEALKAERIAVYTTEFGEEAIELTKLYDYDLMLLDIGLPDISGFEVIRELRQGKIAIPILVLSNLCMVEDKVKALQLGADDYMTKPYHKDELVARIQALVRRSKGQAQQVLEVGNLRLNLTTREVHVNGHPLHLTGNEYHLLELLFLRRGTTVSKEMLYAYLYNNRPMPPESKIIHVMLCKIRKKIERIGQGKFCLETVWGRGYVLKEPEVPAALPVQANGQAAAQAPA